MSPFFRDDFPPPLFACPSMKAACCFRCKRVLGSDFHRSVHPLPLVYHADFCHHCFEENPARQGFVSAVDYFAWLYEFAELWPLTWRPRAKSSSAH